MSAFAAFCCIFLLFISGAHSQEEPLSKDKQYAVSSSYSDGDNLANVYDEALPPNKAAALAQHFADSGGWQFALSDEELTKFSRKNGNMQWLRFYSPELVKDSILGRVCRNVFRRMKLRSRYYPREALGVMLAGGATSTLIENHEDADELYILVFLSGNVTKNSYGQLTLYTKDGDAVMGSVFRKFRRMTVFNGSMPFILKPPAIGSHLTDYSLLIKWTKNLTKYEEGQKSFEALQRKRNESALAPFPTLFDVSERREGYTAPTFNKHIHDIFYDKFGNHMVVFDDIFSKSELDTLRDYLTTYPAGRRYGKYIEDESEDADNVRWITTFELAGAMQSKVWNIVYDMAVYLSGLTGWYPYDVALNIVQSVHHTRFHTDCMDNEFEYTFLLYLNPDWTADKYGETTFTDLKEGIAADEVRNQQFDVKAVVQPKYGRIAMFRNIINHSARPPSPDFLDSRYSFAIKVSANRRIAEVKRLMELLEDLPLYASLHEDCVNGKYNSITPNEPVDFISDTIMKINQECKQNYTASMEHLLSMFS